MSVPQAHDRPLTGMEWGVLSRRHFLKSLLWSSAAVGAGGSLTACDTGGGRGADGRALLYLDAGEAALLSALGEAIIPTQEGFPTLEQAGVVRRVDEEMLFVGDSIQSDIHAALAVLQWTPLLYGHFSRYTQLAPEQRREVLRRMMVSGSETLRAVATNLKILIQFFYFAHPATWKATGYDGPFSHLPPIVSEQRRWYAEKTGDTA